MCAKSKSDPRNMPTDYCTIACNTNGYDREAPIVEVSAVKVMGGHAVAAFRSFVSCQKIASDDMRANANITDLHLKDAPSLEEAMGGLLEFVEDLPLIGAKYGRFIKPYIERDALRACGVVMENEWRDILWLADRMNLLTRDSLTDLCEQLHVEKERTHRALIDALASWRCWELMRRRALGDTDRPEWLWDDVPVTELGPTDYKELDAEREALLAKSQKIAFYAFGAFFLLISIGLYYLLRNSMMDERSLNTVVGVPGLIGIVLIVVGRALDKRKDRRK